MSVAAAPLQPLRAAAHAQKATINDLLLGAVTHGLRDLLTARGECRESMFVRTIVPVALDHSRQAASLMVVDLPVGDPDPTRRLAAITQRTRARKAHLRATRGTRQTCCRCRSRSPGCSFPGPADVAAPESTCPSPTCPGHRPALVRRGPARRGRPRPPLVPLVGLTVAALSYTDRLTVAVNADGAVRDLDILRDGITTALAHLVCEGHSADSAKGALYRSPDWGPSASTA